MWVTNGGLAVCSRGARGLRLKGARSGSVTGKLFSANVLLAENMSWTSRKRGLKRALGSARNPTLLALMPYWLFCFGRCVWMDVDRFLRGLSLPSYAPFLLCSVPHQRGHETGGRSDVLPRPGKWKGPYRGELLQREVLPSQGTKHINIICVFGCKGDTVSFARRGAALRRPPCRFVRNEESGGRSQNQSRTRPCRLRLAVAPR